MAKKPVDVEDVLVWAASELARKRPGNVVGLPVFDVSRADRQIVGRWTWPMGFPEISPMFSPGYPTAGKARGEPPDPDALVIEDALTRLRLVGIAFDAAVEEDVRHGLGFELDAASLLRSRGNNVANLLLVHGRLGSRPPLGHETLQPLPKLAPNGKPGVWRREVWAEPTFGEGRPDAEVEHEVAVTSLKKKNAYPSGAYCILDWEPSADSVIAERAEYWAWRAGLVWLADALEGKLNRRIAMPPRAAERPWMGDFDQPAWRDPFGAGAERVYGGEDAAGMQTERRFGRRRPVSGGNVYAAPGSKARRGAVEV